MGNTAVLRVNAGILWKDVGAADFGEANHCIIIRSIALHPDSREMLGAQLLDATRKGELFILSERLIGAWLCTGGEMFTIEFPARPH